MFLTGFMIGALCAFCAAFLVAVVAVGRTLDGLESDAPRAAGDGCDLAIPTPASGDSLKLSRFADLRSGGLL